MSDDEPTASRISCSVNEPRYPCVMCGGALRWRRSHWMGPRPRTQAWMCADCGAQEPDRP